MSYILDALKRADADRERDAAGVPDLHAQTDVAHGALRSTRPGRSLLWAAAAAIAVAVLAWQWFDTAPTNEPTPLSVAQEAAPALTAPPAQPPVAAISPLVPQSVTAPPPGPPAVAPDPAPIPSLAAIPESPPRAPAREAAATPAAPPRSAASPTPATAPATETRVQRLAELPADVRSKLPALVVGGSMYSPNARSRMVILNGQVFREGDKLAEGLSVERIGLKSTVLVYRDLRFELKH